MKIMQGQIPKNYKRPLKQRFDSWITYKTRGVLQPIIWQIFKWWFKEEHCGVGETFQRRRYQIHSSLWVYICGNTIGESVKHYRFLSPQPKKEEEKKL